MTYVDLTPQAKFEFKDSSITAQKLPDMLPLSPMHETMFCQKTEVFSSNFQFTCGAKFCGFEPKSGWSDLNCIRKTGRSLRFTLISETLFTVVITATVFVPHCCSFFYLITVRGSVSERYTCHDFILIVVC